jgi:hypothetical protein
VTGSSMDPARKIFLRPRDEALLLTCVYEDGQDHLMVLTYWPSDGTGQGMWMTTRTAD